MRLAQELRVDPDWPPKPTTTTEAKPRPENGSVYQIMVDCWHPPNLVSHGTHSFRTVYAVNLFRQVPLSNNTHTQVSNTFYSYSQLCVFWCLVCQCHFRCIICKSNVSAHQRRAGFFKIKVKKKKGNSILVSKLASEMGLEWSQCKIHFVHEKFIYYVHTTVADVIFW